MTSSAMADRSLLRATAESGDVVDDPSEDRVFMMFEDIEMGFGSYLIVEDLGDSTSQTYAQTCRNDDGTYIVEYRDGGPTQHYGTTVADMRAAHELILGWMWQLPGWHESATWELVSL